MANALLLPVFIQVSLTFILLFMMAGVRARANRQDPTLLTRAAIDTSFYPEKVQLISKAYENQTELPILFYSVIAFSILTAHESILMTAFAWVFVLTRLVHAFIHTTSNAVIPRFVVFLVGTFSLIAMWGLLAFNIFSPA